METLELKDLSLDDLMDGIVIGEGTEGFINTANKSEGGKEGTPCCGQCHQ